MVTANKMEIITEQQKQALLDDPFFAEMLAAINGNTPEAREAAAEFEKPTGNPISLKIESIIKRGMLFNITPESFSVSGSISNLTPDDQEYLRTRKDGILCHLQQSFLTKIGFFRIKDNYDDFAQAIEETQAILDSSRDVAIIDVTRRYFRTFQHEGETI